MNLGYFKTFLWPPEELLKQVKFDQNGYWGIDIIPYIDTEIAMEIYTLAEVEKIRALWMYRFRFSHHLDSQAFKEFEKQNKEQGFTQHSLLTVSELIKNFFEHGNKGRKGSLAYLAYWFTEKGIILGARDEGDFYSKPETAKKFEDKFTFESTKDDPSGHGIKGFYDDSDFLRVVPEQNALFAGFLFKSDL